MNGSPFLTTIKEKQLTSRDIIRIIKATSSNCNLKSLKFGELCLEFGLLSQVEPESLAQVPARANEQVISKIESDVVAQVRADSIEEDLDQLRLIDPLAYERMVEGEFDGNETS